MTKKEIELFLIKKPGYLKKSAIITAKAFWKSSEKHKLPKNEAELQKELDVIREVTSTIRTAKTIKTENTESELMNIYDRILQIKNKPKTRIFFDLEVSANIVFSWRVGRDISLSPDDIIQERAIICVCWKWEHENKVHSISWNKGDDKELVEKFAKIIDSADEVVGQNSDRFDIKWLRARCIYHGVPVSTKFNSIDTLKMARAGFNFNSNKLDYMGQFLGVGKKTETGYQLWKDITLNNSKEAMGKMVDYCKNDVLLLERVFNKLASYCPKKKFKYKI